MNNNDELNRILKNAGLPLKEAPVLVEPKLANKTSKKIVNQESPMARRYREFLKEKQVKKSDN